MNAVLRPALELEDHEEELEVLDSQGAALPFVLKKLRPRHKSAMALIAQGYKNTEVAAMTDYTKEYISALLRQPLCIEYVRGMNEAVAAQLEAQFGQVADVITEAFAKGSTGEKLKAARLHLEVTKRIGAGREQVASSQSSEERLAGLAHRLIDLMGGRGAGHGNVIESPSMQGFASIQREQVQYEGEGREQGPDEDGEGD